MKQLKNERGFTLIEVVASLVIITIVLISFSQLFVQSSKTAKYNNEKLVLINLADAELERIQAIAFPNTGALNSYIQNQKELTMNKKKYVIKIDDTTNDRSENLNELGLIHLRVTTSINSSKSVAEGYVKIHQ